MVGRQHGRAHSLFGEFPIRHPQRDFGNIIFSFGNLDFISTYNLINSDSI